MATTSQSPTALDVSGGHAEAKVHAGGERHKRGVCQIQQHDDEADAQASPSCRHPPKAPKTVANSSPGCMAQLVMLGCAERYEQHAGEQQQQQQLVILQGVIVDTPGAAGDHAEVPLLEGSHAANCHQQQDAVVPPQLEPSAGAAACSVEVTFLQPATTAAAAEGPATAAQPAAAEPKQSVAGIFKLLPTSPKLPVQKLPLFLQISYLREHGFLPYEDGTWSRQGLIGVSTGVGLQPAAAARTSATGRGPLNSGSKKNIRVQQEDSKTLVDLMAQTADVQPVVHEPRTYASSTDRGKLWEEHLLTLRMINLELSAVAALQQFMQQFEQLNRAFASRPCLSCKTKRPTCGMWFCSAKPACRKCSKTFLAATDVADDDSSTSAGVAPLPQEVWQLLLQLLELIPAPKAAAAAAVPGQGGNSAKQGVAVDGATGACGGGIRPSADAAAAIGDDEDSAPPPAQQQDQVDQQQLPHQQGQLASAADRDSGKQQQEQEQQQQQEEEEGDKQAERNRRWKLPEKGYNAGSDLLPLWREHQLNLQVILHSVSDSPQAVSLVHQTVDRCFNRRCIRCLSASPGSHCGKGTFFCGNCMRVFGKKQHFSEEACWQAVKEGRAVDPDYKRGKS